MSKILSQEEVEFIKSFTNILHEKYDSISKVASFEINSWDHKMMYIVLEDSKEWRDKLIKILQDKNLSIWQK